MRISGDIPFSSVDLAHTLPLFLVFTPNSAALSVPFVRALGLITLKIMKNPPVRFRPGHLPQPHPPFSPISLYKGNPRPIPISPRLIFDLGAENVSRVPNTLVFVYLANSNETTQTNQALSLPPPPTPPRPTRYDML